MKRVLKWIAWTAGVLTVILSLLIGAVILSVDSYTAGQIVACNRSLMIHPDVKYLMLYCEEEGMGVYIKSGVDKSFKWSVSE